MKISNKRKFNKINLCDLMKELGRNFACLEINKAFNTLSKNHSAQGFEGYIVMNCDKNKTIHKICHSVPDTESEVCACANTNANSPRHICESTEVTPLCHAELCLTAFSEISDFVKNVWFSTASYQRGVDNFNVNTFLKQIYTFITGQILSQAQNDSISNMADLVGRSFHPNIGGVK